MTNERRARYAEAIGHALAGDSPARVSVADAVADAAMAVADTERDMNRGAARLIPGFQQEVARLSAENAELHRHHREDQDALAEMRATIERLRSELDENTSVLNALRRQRDEAIEGRDNTVQRALEDRMKETTRLRGAVERVRAVLDAENFWIGTNASDFAAKIRTALEGDS